MNATLQCWIAGGDGNPAIGQHVLAELSVERQLIAAGLGHLRGRGQLIVKENAFACGGEKLGRHPFGLTFGDSRQTPEIDRVKLHRPHVKKVVVEIASYLGNDLRLSDSASTPDVQGQTLADQRLKRLIELRWFYGDFLGRRIQHDLLGFSCGRIALCWLSA
ncbi:MAG TPA: hypothetical protein VI320_24930 [Terracidiphilus sp.]